VKKFPSFLITVKEFLPFLITVPEFLTLQNCLTAKGQKTQPKQKNLFKKNQDFKRLLWWSQSGIIWKALLTFLKTSIKTQMFFHPPVSSYYQLYSST
jgi:hypothetical protein